MFRRVFRLLGILLLLVPLGLCGQELSCQVTVQAPTAQSLDPNIIRQMQQDITQYMNNRRWTTDRTDPQERIKCSITIVFTNVPSSDRFEGTATVQATRPVYGATYETLILNFQDKDFKANYLPSQPLEYSENTFTSNMANMLNFYAFMILGFDYDSFAPNGGDAYYQRARNVINLAASSAETGWTASDGLRNRYWLLENMQNNSYAALHDIAYTYHRSGLDKMGEDPSAGREAIIRAVTQLQQLNNLNPSLFAVRVFLDTKANELVQVFLQGTPDEKQKLLAAMEIIDPANISAYERVGR